MLIPRVISKEVFRWVFSDGERPISSQTLFKKFVDPYLDQIQISVEEYKAYRNIPFKVNRALIRLHEIQEEELLSALEIVKQKRLMRARLLRASLSK